MAIRALSSTQYGFPSLREAMESYFERGWTDGLPVVPPTEQDVRVFLEHTMLHPSDILGVVPVHNREVTVEKVAVNAAMAGCKPEYMPVVIAGVEAMMDEAFNIQTMTIATTGRAVMLLINGPVRSKLGFNSGLGLFGPGHRANATVGRAMRLIQINVCGGSPGVLNRSNLGHPGQYTMCIAEDEEFSSWDPFHLTRGFSREDSTVTAMASVSPVQVTSKYSERPEDILASYADGMRVIAPSQGEIMVIIPRQLMSHIKKAGWSYARVQEFLHGKARRPAREWAKVGQISLEEGDRLGDEPVPCCVSPQGFYIIPAGGDAGIEGAFLYASAGAAPEPDTRAVTRKIDTSKL